MEHRLTAQDYTDKLAGRVNRTDASPEASLVAAGLFAVAAAIDRQTTLMRDRSEAAGALLQEQLEKLNATTDELEQRANWAAAAER
jgi:hypothetical protein